MALVAPCFDRDICRLLDEFRALPGLKLTVSQVARVLGVPEHEARRILDTLEDGGLLVHSASGVYRRRPA